MIRFAEVFTRNYYRLPTWLRYLLVPFWVVLAAPFMLVALIFFMALVGSIQWCSGEDEPVNCDDLDGAGDF